MKEEKRKMDLLIKNGKRVDRYILVLSEDISVQKKDDILDIMSEYIKCSEDVIMKADLNNLLSMPKYKEIEDKYYQLWYPSTNILNRKLFDVVNGVLLQKSKMCYADMIEEKQIFVETSVYKEIISKVHKNKTVIISGEPGVGKTMLGKQVALFYLGKYHTETFINVSDMNDLYTALKINGKKVIFFDDFWGGNQLEKIKVQNVSKELTRIIKTVKKRNDCILIITTREYVLEQGLKYNEELRNIVKKYKLECLIQQYSDADKLQIYYGHLKHAELAWKQTYELMKHGNLVINSKNYNPRVLEMFFESVETNMLPDKCTRILDRYLECPLDFWKDIFNGLSKEARILYVIMAIAPLPIEASILRKFYNNYIQKKENSYEWKNFFEVQIELEKTVIRTDLYDVTADKVLVVTFQNPSAKDFLIDLLKNNFFHYKNIIDDSCMYYSQYVEYLRILDIIGAPIEIYETIYEKALDAIDTDSILFYDKYKIILQYNDKEIQKYNSNFKTYEKYSDIGMGRFIQLLTMYNTGNDNNIKNKMKQIFMIIMRNINNYPELVLSEDLRVMPEAISVMYKNGLLKNVMPILEIYMDVLMRNWKSIAMYDIEINDDFPDVWEKYLEKHRYEIAQYLEKYYTADICMAAMQDDKEEFECSIVLCEECFFQYKLEIPENLKQKIEIYRSWIEDEDTNNEEIFFQNNMKKQDIKEIQNEFEKDFLFPIRPKKVDNLPEWIAQSGIPSEIKSILCSKNLQDDLLLDKFINDEDSLNFLVKFINYEMQLPDNICDITKKFINYVLKQSNLNQEDIYKFIENVNYRENSTWTQEQLKEMCSDIILENEMFLPNMVEAGILIKSQHWYRCLNDSLLIYLKLGILLSQNKIADFYKSIKEDFLDGPDIYEKIVYVCTNLYETDYFNFKKYLLVPAIKGIYQELLQHKGNWEDKLIDYLDYEYECENNEITGGIGNGDTDLQIIEVFSGSELWSNIEEKFTKENIKKLQEVGIIKQKGISKITLKMIQEKGLLHEFGIHEELEIFWNKINKYKDEV